MNVNGKEVNMSTAAFLLNQAVFMLAKATIFLAVLHLVYVTSATHAVVIALSLITVEIMNFQLKYMINTAMTTKTTTTLKAVADLVEEVAVVDDTTNNTTH